MCVCMCSFKILLFSKELHLQGNYVSPPNPQSPNMPQGEEQRSAQEKGEADSKLHSQTVFMASRAMSPPKMVLGNTVIKQK